MADENRILFLSTIDARRYDAFEESYPAAWLALGMNSGNLAFTSGIQHYLEQAGTPYDIVPFTTQGGIGEAVEWDRYSACIINVSNWLAAGRVRTLEMVARAFRGVKVPTYMIGLGAQAPKNAGPTFVKELEPVARDFIRTLLETGGGFGLRGPFTAECFDALGFKNDYTVTGCPSFFQRGDKLKIETRPIARQSFRPLMNGHKYQRSPTAMQALLDTDGGTFVCQDEFARLLHYYDDLSIYDRRGLLTLEESVRHLLGKGRVRLFGGFWQWIDFILAGGFNFSIGSRVHGNVFALLAGVPCLFDTVDSRTAELVDYFALPKRSGSQSVSRADELYALHSHADYSMFNRVFPERLAAFQAFLRRHQLPMKAEADKLDGHVPEAVPPQLSEKKLVALLEDYARFQPLPIPRRVADKRVQYILKQKVLGRKL